MFPFDKIFSYCLFVMYARNLTRLSDYVVDIFKFCHVWWLYVTEDSPVDFDVGLLYYNYLAQIQDCFKMIAYIFKWHEVPITDQGGDWCEFVFDAYAVIKRIEKRLIYIEGHHQHGMAFVKTNCITCDFDYSQAVTNWCRIFRFVEICVSVPLDLFYQNSNIFGDLFASRYLQ